MESAAQRAAREAYAGERILTKMVLYTGVHTMEAISASQIAIWEMPTWYHPFLSLWMRFYVQR